MATKYLALVEQESHFAIPFFNFDLVLKSVEPAHEHEPRGYPLVCFPFVDQ